MQKKKSDLKVLLANYNLVSEKKPSQKNGDYNTVGGNGIEG